MIISHTCQKLNNRKMERFNNWYSPDLKFRIVELSRELEYKSGSVLRKELVELNALKHNPVKKCYELTDSAISCGLGEIRTKVNPKSNFRSQFNVFSVSVIVDFLNQGIPL